MTGREWSRRRSARVALSALAISAVLAVWALARALRVEPLPPVQATTLAMGSMSSIGRRPPAAIQDAVDKDVFSPDRTAPAARYRMPGEPDSHSRNAAPEPPKPVVLGTAVSPDGRNFATVVVADSAPRMVRVGDRIGDYIVKSIERGRVAFITPAGRRVDVISTRLDGRSPDQDTQNDESASTPDNSLRNRVVRRLGRPGRGG